MAKTRSKSALVKAFERSDCPIYLIDAQHRLAYGNEAFFEWVDAGSGRQPLIGTRLVYSSSPDLTADEMLLCGLTPPPALVQRGQPFSATVSRRQASAANLLQQQPVSAQAPSSLDGASSRADFFFIDSMDSGGTLLAVVRSTSSADSFDGQSSIGDPIAGSGSEDLHRAIKRLGTALGPWQRSLALVGESAYVVRLQKQVKAASQHAMEFTIVGPDGTGREFLARTIMAQRMTPGSNAISENELITVHGYVADIELIRTCIEQANDLAKEIALESSHRTDRVQPWLLILDADQLDAASQAELWAALQSPASRLKVVATAQRDLMRCVRDDGYHGGLAHLLTTQTIQTDDIKDHLSDLPMIIQHLVEQGNVDRRQSISGCSVAALQLLTGYHWPGNLTELTSVITAAAEHCDTHEIDVDDLPEKFRFAIAALKRPVKPVVEIDLEKYLGQIELKLVDRALKAAKGNKTKAAKLLGVSRAKLLRRIQHFDLQQLEIDPKFVADAAMTGGDLPTNDLSADDFRPLDEPLFEEADD